VSGEFVFGYGSLAAEVRGAPLAVATLGDHGRRWNVAMNNRDTIPGYKWYVDPVSGERPGVFVTFLDVIAEAGTQCVGFLLPLTSPSELVALDRRERNYDRADVTSLISIETSGVSGVSGVGGADGAPDRVWTYLGTPSARQRYAEAAGRGEAVIQASYLEGVEAVFAARGLLARYRASTRSPECPVLSLTRVNDSSLT
jgi:cation transport regulator ChaC